MWGVLAVTTAITIQRLWVPKLRTPHVEPGDLTPNFRPLGSWPHLVLVALLSIVAVAPNPTPIGLWIGYVGIGAPLVVVDWRTTYLPNQLMFPLWATMALGLSVQAAIPPSLPMETIVGALLGAAAAYGLFWLVWRFSHASFGFGDVRLAAAVGAVTGSHGATHWATAFVAGTALGAACSIIAAARGSRISAYGPSLWLGPAIATWLSFAFTRS